MATTDRTNNRLLRLLVLAAIATVMGLALLSSSRSSIVLAEPQHNAEEAEAEDDDLGYVELDSLTGFASPWHPTAVPGAPAPSFTGKTHTGEELVLDEVYIGRWTVLLFDPAEFVPEDSACAEELVSFSDIAAKFGEAEAQVLAVSGDVEKTLHKWSDPACPAHGHKLAIPVLHDPEHKLAQGFGLAHTDGGVHIVGKPFRASAIIGPDRVVRIIMMQDPAVPRNAEDLLTILVNFQAAEHRKVLLAANMGAKRPTAADVESYEVHKEHVILDVQQLCELRFMVKHPDVYLSDVDVTVQQLSGGLTNKLFKCSLIRSGAEMDTELVRLFGQNTEILIDRERERQVVQELTAANFGCAMTGVFANGRFEEFLSGRALEVAELAQPEIAADIARQFARLHTLDLSGKKEATVFPLLRKWIDLASTALFRDPERVAEATTLAVPNLRKEYAWLEEQYKTIESPIVMCHNDLLAFNVMKLESGELKLIDFEYSDYNPRGFDLGNHFNEYGGPDCNYENYPDRAARDAFYKEYLMALGAPTTPEALEALDKETLLGGMASHLLWAVWGVLQQSYSTIPFDYLSFGELRMARYLVDKKAWEANF